MLHDAGSAGSPEFQKLRKKNLVDSALSWFKVLRPTSMNQKFPYILRISERAKAFQGLIGPVADWQMPEGTKSLALGLAWRVLTLPGRHEVSGCARNFGHNARTARLNR
jgi:hypothetical protein